MGLQLSSRCGKSSPAIIIMKQFVLLLAAVSPLALAEAEADAEADPWYGNHAYGHHGRAHHAYGHSHVAVAHHAPAVAVAPKCHTVYDTVTSSACSTVSEPVCSTRSVTNYETKHEQKCSSRPVEECEAVPREVPREQCVPARCWCQLRVRRCAQLCEQAHRVI